MRRSVLFALVLAAAGAARADTPIVLAHSGFLLDGADLPAESAGLAMSFRIVDQPTATLGETASWGGSCAVPVHAGYYSVTLGGGECGTDLFSTAMPAGAPRFLEVTVHGTVLAPRV